MKKISMILVWTTVVFTMASCSNPTLQSMYEMYTQASEAMQNADSLVMDTSASFDMEYQGEKLTMSMTGSVAEVIKSETDMDMKMNMTTSIMGQDIPVEAFYKDGVYYINTMGQKMKMPMPIDQIVQQAGTESFNFPETAIKNESITDVDNGKKLAFTLDGSALSDVLRQQMAGLQEIMDLNAEMTFGDVSLEAVIGNDKNLKSTRLIFSLDMVMEGEAMKMTCDMTMNITQLGGVTIDFPSDLEEYVAA